MIRSCSQDRAGLDDRKIALGRSRRVNLSRHDCLFQTGDDLARCYVLEKGIISREQTAQNGRRQIVGLSVPGDVCGLSDIIGGRAAHDAVAHTAVTFVPVDRRWLLTKAREAGELQEAIWADLAREAAFAAAWVTNLGQRTAYRRVAYLICELNARLNASGHGQEDRARWYGTQTDLGAAAGLSVVHVNRTLKNLINARLATSARGIYFENMAALREVCCFNPELPTTDRGRLGDILIELMSTPESGVEGSLRPSQFTVVPRSPPNGINTGMT